MDAAVLRETESLRRLSVGGLREEYRAVSGEDSRSHHKDFLFRRIAWRLPNATTLTRSGPAWRGCMARSRNRPDWR